MSDEEFQANIDFLLDGLWQGHQDLEGAHAAYVEAGDAFLAEVQGGGNVRRLQALRQTVGRAGRRGRVYWDTQSKRIDALNKLLRDWRSPGPNYTRFVEQARRLIDSYVRDMSELAESARYITTAAEAFDAFIDAAR